ncbi:hypothetical protein IFM89_002817 [Coptis chinensis]|uniref:TF-B3 domain-containing protein n=1 Tax=Coptis chinensis TaxID=261450 RepID=A0A835HTH7_9MAGN|nr:hypothetical protein IFM89_002817 [Coptis chinensis]
MEFEACEECSKTCLLIHGNKNPLPIVSSFFKIMVGDNFSASLAVPPRFVPTIKSLVDQKVDLEDSKGQRWEVHVCWLGGRLVFQQGWRQFASDHSLEIGDFLVFNYFIGSHFVVQIYCKSGCEKFTQQSGVCMGRNSSTEMSFGHQNSDDKSSTPEEFPPLIVEKGTINEQGSCSSVHSGSNIDVLQSNHKVLSDVEKILMSTEETNPCDHSTVMNEPVLSNDCNNEVPFYMIERELIDVEEANRSCLFDLSNFERVADRSVVDKMDEGPLILEKESSPKSKPVQSQTRQETHYIEEQCNIIESVSMDRERAYRGSALDMSDFEVAGRRCHAQVTDRVPFFKVSKERSPPDANPVQLQTRLGIHHIEEQFKITKSESMDRERACRGSALNISEFEVPLGRCHAQVTERVPLFKVSEESSPPFVAKPVQLQTRLGIHHIEEQSKITESESMERQRACRGSALNISEFEVPLRMCHAQVTERVPLFKVSEESSPPFDAKPVQLLTRLGIHHNGEQCKITESESMERERACRGSALNVSDFEVPERRCHTQVTDRVPLFEVSKGSCTSQQPERAHDSTKEVPILKDKGSMTYLRSQTTITTEWTGNPMGNAETYGTLRRFHLPENRTSMFSGKDSTSEMKHNVFARTSGNTTKAVKDMPGCGNDQSMKARNCLPVEKRKRVKEEYSGKVDENQGKKLKAIKEELMESVEEQRVKPCLKGKKPVVKVELEEEVYPSKKVQGQANKVVKLESVDSIFPSPLCCSVYAVSQFFLSFTNPFVFPLTFSHLSGTLEQEFPGSLSEYFWRGKHKMERKIVLLRDRDRRMWPVLYHLRFGHGEIASGWRAVFQANRIQEGDRCDFEIEDESESIFHIRIVRK